MRVDAGTRSETIWDLIRIHAIECHPDAEPGAASTIFHKYEFALPRLREIGKEAILVITGAMAAFVNRYRGPGARCMRGYDWRCDGGVIMATISGKDMGSAYVLRNWGAFAASIREWLLTLVGVAIGCACSLASPSK